MKTLLENHYTTFFKDMKIDGQSGYLKNNPSLKFSTFPFIGSRYGETKKILIVGLDMGSDEKLGGIQSFKERREAIEEKDITKHNPHISGTYFTALFFLKENLNWQKQWSDTKNIPSCQKALQKQNLLPIINPLSYIALTNYYKFVSVNRKNRSGGENRRYIDKETEVNFFIKEVKIFNPDIIIFQSNAFAYKRKLLRILLNMGKLIYIGPHPAYRGKREPEYYISRINQLKQNSKKIQSC